MVRLPARPWKDPWPAEGLVLEHVEENPKRFMTRKDLQTYCKKNHIQSGALL